MITLGEIRDIKRRLKISRLVKVYYIISYTTNLYINAYAIYKFSDGYKLRYTVETYTSEKDVKMVSHRHFIEFRKYVDITFYNESPVFEFCNYVTQL